MKTEEKFVLQAKKITEIYGEQFVPNEAKLQIMQAMKEQLDTFYNEMEEQLQVKG